MKTIRMSFVLASLAGAASLLLVAPVSMSASPSEGWDDGYFYTGEPITAETSSYQSAAPQGFDLFNSGEGVKVEDFASAYMGTSMGSAASGGWDVFRIGDGDPLP